MTDSPVASLVMPEAARAYSAGRAQAIARDLRMDGARTGRFTGKLLQGTEHNALPGNPGLSIHIQ